MLIKKQYHWFPFTIKQKVMQVLNSKIIKFQEIKIHETWDYIVITNVIVLRYFSFETSFNFNGVVFENYFGSQFPLTTE